MKARSSLEKVRPRRHPLGKTCRQCGVALDPKDINYGKKIFCSLPCFKDSIRHTPEKAAAAFWSRVDKHAPGGCWYYMGARDKLGYGDCNFMRKHIQAHRLAWKLVKGEPGKLDVLHKCHKPPCCNPDHLYLGTDIENTRDRVAIGNTTWGERNHTAKLKAEDVKKIRAEYRYDRRGYRHRSNAKELAARYGVTKACITAIVARRTWDNLK